MEAVCVYLLRPGQDQWGPSDCTNEQGRFDITSIPAGEYVLVANQDGKPSSLEPFPRVFYPNVYERDRAAVINIAQATSCLFRVVKKQKSESAECGRAEI